MIPDSGSIQHPADAARIRRIILEVLFWLAVAMLAAWVVYALRSVFLLLILTIFFCYLVVPLVQLVEHPFRFGDKIWHIPHTPAVIIVYLLLVAGLVIIFEKILPMLADQISEMLDNFPIYARSLDQYFRWLISLPNRYRLPMGWRQSLTGAANEAAVNVIEWIKIIAARSLRITFYLPWLVLIPAIGFFFLKDARSIANRLLDNLPEGDTRYRMTLFLSDINATIAAYIRAQVLAGVIVAVIEGVGLWLLGLRYALVFGVAAGLLEFIPLVGPLAFGVIAVLVASFTSWNLAFMIAGFLILFRIIHDYVIYPRLVSKGIEIPPVVVILAVISGAELGGVIGIFLSIPIVALLLVIWRHWHELYPGRSSVPVAPDHEQIVEAATARD